MEGLPSLTNYKKVTIFNGINIKAKEVNYNETKILIIKIGALGDVIRTTTILQAIRKKCPKHYISWLIKEDSKEVLEGHPLLDEVLVYNADTLARLQIEAYDLVINLDKDQPSTSIATLVKSPKKLGFGCDENGKTTFFNEEAQYLYENGLNDNLNKKNPLFSRKAKNLKK